MNGSQHWNTGPVRVSEVQRWERFAAQMCHLCLDGTSQVALVVKNPPAHTREVRDIPRGSVPWYGRSPGGGHGNPLQCSCLQNPMDRGAWWATVHGVAKSHTQPKWLSTYTHTQSCLWIKCSDEANEAIKKAEQCLLSLQNKCECWPTYKVFFLFENAHNHYTWGFCWKWVLLYVYELHDLCTQIAIYKFYTVYLNQQVGSQIYFCLSLNILLLIHFLFLLCLSSLNLNL